MTRSIFALLLLTVAGVAAGLRWPQLDARPMHADEAVQARRFRDLWIDHRYRYDPDEFHGPTLHYATLPSVWWQRVETYAHTTKATYRIVPAVFGVCLILLLFFLADALGRPATLAAALLAAVSPAMVFYSRYYIHETLLLFFTLAAIVAVWRYLQSGRLAWCLLAGVAAGLMQATKETAVLSFAAAGAATVLTVLGNRLRTESLPHLPTPRPIPWWHLACGLAAALVTALILYTSFGANPRGIIDAVMTYFPWISRAGGASPHTPPWYFYFHRLGWWQVADGPRCSEGLILLLALMGLGSAMSSRDRGTRLPNLPALRWLSFYTVVLAGAYTLIPYKTPWCSLQFLIGMVLLAGFGAWRIVALTPTIALKGALVATLLGLTGQLGGQAYRAAFLMPADPRNPWVYAHATADIERLADDVQQLTAASPDGAQTTILVIYDGPYYWPLPWYLRAQQHVGYWTQMPDDAQAALVISSPKYDADLTAQLDDTHLMTGYYANRPSELVQVWVRMDVWEAHLRRLGRL
jgi:uncharacterized protein (TIGR03663 family)